MYIESVPNRNSPPAILLRESYRDGGKIKKRTIANLSNWPTELVEGLRTLLKGGKVAPADQETIIVRRALPHGHAHLLEQAAKEMGGMYVGRAAIPDAKKEPEVLEPRLPPRSRIDEMADRYVRGLKVIEGRAGSDGD